MYQVVCQVLDGGDAEYQDQRDQGGVPWERGDLWDELTGNRK